MKKGSILLLAAFGILAIGAMGAWFGMQQGATTAYRADVVEALTDRDQLSGFERAVAVHRFEFPSDFGPHPGFQTEWWYYTGNLTASNGDRFGYQLTFFRRALAAKPLHGLSKWRSNQVYFAHFAVTDVTQKKFHSSERFSREALGLAGAQANPYRVWIEDWQVYRERDEFIIEAGAGEAEIRFRLKAEKPIVLQGNRGLSQKGPETGNASYYFSQTRLATRGIIRSDSVVSEVTGTSWLDREWSTSALAQGESGWDWFALQLDDNRELMLFQIRSGQGRISDFSSGTYVDRNGRASYLSREEFIIRVTESWKSPHTGITYPAGWLIDIPKHHLQLTISPLLNDQEHRLSFIYWEGAARIISDTVNGSGYVELTGYEHEAFSM
jgi:predicted secreted hydrolase